MSIESILEIYESTDLDNDTKVRMIVSMGKIMNYNAGANITEALVLELCLKLNPSLSDIFEKSINFKGVLDNKRLDIRDWLTTNLHIHSI